jgi:hypothetical protein
MKTERTYTNKGCRSLCTDVLDWLRRAPLRSGCRATLAMTKERFQSISVDFSRLISSTTKERSTTTNSIEWTSEQVNEWKQLEMKNPEGVTLL